MLIAACALLVVGMVLLWLAQWTRKRAGLPRGRVVYVDNTELRRLEMALYDPLTDMTGRPDYLLQKDGELLPVEIKASLAPNWPYHSHVMQLAAYCHLVEAVYGKPPSRGILRYKDRSFSVDYSPELEDQLMELVAEMRRAEKLGTADRMHTYSARCGACGHRGRCDQRLE